MPCTKYTMPFSTTVIVILQGLLGNLLNDGNIGLCFVFGTAGTAICTGRAAAISASIAIGVIAWVRVKVSGALCDSLWQIFACSPENREIQIRINSKSFHRFDCQLPTKITGIYPRKGETKSTNRRTSEFVGPKVGFHLLFHAGLIHISMCERPYFSGIGSRDASRLVRNLDSNVFGSFDNNDADRWDRWWSFGFTRRSLVLHIRYQVR